MREILIVDDNEASRRIARYAVSKETSKIIESDDGDKAVEVILNEVPKLIILDWKMPKLNGDEMITLSDEMLKQIRHLDPSRMNKEKMDVILYSSEKLQDIVIPRSPNFRFVSYVSKEWPIETQVRKIKSILRQKR